MSDRSPENAFLDAALLVADGDLTGARVAALLGVIALDRGPR